MNINDYFDPVSLEKPEFTLLKDQNTFGRSIKIHTPDIQVDDIASYDIAIVGVREDQNAFVRGAAEAPDKIREKLYLLSYVNNKTRIADLGNLKITGNINDTYYALRDILLELSAKNVTLLVLGGSQDLTYGLCMAYEQFDSFWNLTSLDSKLDFGWGKEKINSKNYLDRVFNLKNASRLNYVNIGHQIYFTPTRLLDKLEDKGHESIKLGVARNNIRIAEPVLRDTSVFSIDMSSVRQSDAPGASIPTPNGFFGHELCQIARYAGASEVMKVMGIFEISPGQDLNHHTSHLAAQAAWYFIDGHSLKIKEDPLEKGSKKYIVDTGSSSEQLVFYNSNLTDRWWMELPVTDPLTKRNYLIACSYEDYMSACNNEIPDRWWRRMRRYS